MKNVDLMRIIEDAFENQAYVDEENCIAGKQFMIDEIERKVMTKEIRSLVDHYQSEIYGSFELIVEKDVLTISTSWNTYEEGGEDSFIVDLRKFSIETISSGHTVDNGDFDNSEEDIYEDFDVLLEELNEKFANLC